MKIWLLLLVPVLSTILIYSFGQIRKNLTWYEVALKLIISFLIILSLKSCTEYQLTRDEETLVDYVVYVEHRTYWNEWISETCTRECCCVRDSKGNETCGTETYDCSYEDEKIPYTIVKTKFGKTYTFYEGFKPRGGSAPTKFLQLKKKFNSNKVFVRTHKSKINTHYDKRNVSDLDKKFIGNVFSIKWNGELNRIEDVAYSHTYENRVQASNSIISFPELDTSDIKNYGIYEYPKYYNRYKLNSVLGKKTNLDEYIRQRNSLIGHDKQLKIFYVFFKNKSRKSALLQEQYWKGGNKNEVIICIGLDDEDKIDWSYIFSWSKKTDFKIDIRNHIESYDKFNELNFKKIIDYSFEHLIKDFKRREFVEFSYLTIDTPLWIIYLTVCLVIVIDIILSIFLIKNELNM